MTPPPPDQITQMVCNIENKHLVKDTVTRKIKNCDPRKPPRMVIHSFEASCDLNAIMAANVSTARVKENAHEVDVGRAVI